MSEITTFDVCYHITNAYLTKMAEISIYDWSDEFKISEINKLTDTIKSSDGYFDVDLNELSVDEMKRLYFRIFDINTEGETLYCIPIYLSNFLKKGATYTNIFWQTIELTEDTDMDHRFGSLSFGVLR